MDDISSLEVVQAGIVPAGIEHAVVGQPHLIGQIVHLVYPKRFARSHVNQAEIAVLHRLVAIGGSCQHNQIRLVGTGPYVVELFGQGYRLCVLRTGSNRQQALQKGKKSYHNEYGFSYTFLNATIL